MGKELVISANRHETRVALIEDDQLVEVYFQRANEYSLAGSIHKGRVTRVLPGMQSAFVDLGLERDTFLYVSDFFEEQEDIDTVPDEKPARGERSERNGNRGRQVVRPIVTAQEPPAAATSDAEQAPDLNLVRQARKRRKQFLEHKKDTRLNRADSAVIAAGDRDGAGSAAAASRKTNTLTHPVSRRGRKLRRFRWSRLNQPSTRKKFDPK